MKLNYNKNYYIKIKIKSFIKNNLISDFLILLKQKILKIFYYVFT